MATLTLLETVKRATAAYQRGHLIEAERICRAILGIQRDHFDALLLLAVVQSARALPVEALASYDKALSLRPNDLAALCNRGIILHEQKRFEEALVSYGKALSVHSGNASVLYNRGNTLCELRRFEEALASYDAVLSVQPDNAAALYNRGNALGALQRFDEALASYDRALSIQPDNTAVLCNRGSTLHELKRFEEALASYETALLAQPDDFWALCNRGVTLHALKRFEEALASHDKGLLVRRDDPAALYNRGSALHELKRFEEALASYDKALALRPDDAAALASRGITLHALRRFDEALTSYDRALSTGADDPALLGNRGGTLHQLKRFIEALASFDKALAIQPDDPAILLNRGGTLYKLDRFDEALASYDKALSIQPDSASIHYGRGVTLEMRGRLEEAISACRRALALDPTLPEARALLACLRAHACDWADAGIEWQQIFDAIREGATPVPPFNLLARSSSPEDQLRCAEQWVRKTIGPEIKRFGHRRRPSPRKIRLGYLSADFRNHPGAHAIVGLIENHDRSRFEAAAYSYGPDDHSDIRRRVTVAFDRFVELRGVGIAEAARQIHADGIDVLIDCNGHTRYARTEILAYRPAPIQVNFLGYPGTMGADFIDYIIVDPFVVPADQQPFYRERLVHLPNCYQPNDTKRAIAERTPSRAACGLPPHGLVFCCFNNSYKITPAFFDIWMSLLQAVPGSVLWLLEANPLVKENLRREAPARGVAAERLVFAPRLPLAEHLARHRLADLFLDTLPYNAHVTASDALWAGLPVLTCAGATFAGRVGGSLLRAIGLAELITASPADYASLALRLAREPGALAQLRQRLAQNRSLPLFDIARYARDLEAAYSRMWEIWCAGGGRSDV